MLLSKILKIVLIEIIILMFYIMMSGCSTDFNAEAIVKQNWFYPITIGYKEINSVGGISKKNQNNNCNQKRKRNLEFNVKKHIQNFKRKSISSQNTTCTPFFIRRTTEKQVPSFRYSIPSTSSEPIITDSGFLMEGLETKRGKLRHFFFAKLSCTAASQQLELNISMEEPPKDVTLGIWKNKESSKNKLKKESTCNDNITKDNQYVATKIDDINKTDEDMVSTPKLTAKAISPSIMFDLGLCSGEPKYLMKKPSNQKLMKNTSLPLGTPDLKLDYQIATPAVSTVKFLQKFKLKMLNHYSSKETTTLNNSETFDNEENDHSTQKLSQETVLKNDKDPTGSTSFHSYTKFQVKDLFNFKERPTLEVIDKKPRASSAVYLEDLTKNTFESNRGNIVRTKQTSHYRKHLQATTEPENEYELQSVIVNNTPCECSLDYDININDESSFPLSQSELSVTEPMSLEVETVTSHSFVNLKNLFDQKKWNILSSSNRKSFGYTERVNQHQHRFSIHQTLQKVVYQDLRMSDKSPPILSSVTQKKNKLLQNLSFKKHSIPSTLNTGSTLTPEYLSSISPSVNTVKKNLGENHSTRTDHESIITTTSKRDFLNLKSVLHTQKKQETNANYNDAEEEELSWPDYPTSTTVKVFESQDRPFSNANKSLVDMNPEEFYREFEKSTKFVLNNNSISINKRKPMFKKVFDLMKPTSRSNIIDQSPVHDDLVDSQDSFQTTQLKWIPLKKSVSEVEEEAEYYTSSWRSTNAKFRLNFRTTSQALQGMTLEDSDESVQRSKFQDTFGHNVPVDNVTEEGIDTGDKRFTLNEHEYNGIAIPSLEGTINNGIFKLKSILSLHKPARSNKTKLSYVFDPGGFSSSDKVTIHEQKANTKFKNGFEQNLSTKEYSTKSHQMRETINTEYSTKPVGWWLFWNQPKVTFHKKILNSISSPNKFLGTKPRNSFICTKPTEPQNNTQNFTGNSSNTKSAHLSLKYTERKGDGDLSPKKVHTNSLYKKKYFETTVPSVFYNSSDSIPSSLKNNQIVQKEVTYRILNFDSTKRKQTRTSLNNCSSKNIYNSIKVIGLRKNNKVYKPFERVLNNVQPLGQSNISEFDAKNFSYFIQNLTHSSNDTVVGNSNQTILNSNITKENLSLDLLNKTGLSASSNMTSVNDSSFSIMAYVLRPFESLISVFKGKSTQNMTKVGDVNASDIHNGSIPSHLHPQNSSLVILALNNTNTTSKETHESKVGLFDVLGGWFHCIMETYVEPSPRDIHFYLFTRNNINAPEELFLSEDEVELVREGNITDIPLPVWETQSSSDSGRKKRHIDDEDNSFEPLNFATSELESKWFNLRDETKILIHGYIQDYQTDIIVNMKDAYLKKGAFNVIVVDWSTVGDNTCYPSVAEHGLISVGRLLSRVLDQLVAGGVSLTRVHVVGFSLGAHVAGIAGTNAGGLLSRITGLDPALPYVPMDPDVCLDAGDAVFVDIIHSAAGYLGQPGPTGHVDFYPNGGSQQPGCDLASLGACSHRRSALYFIESINSDMGFKATPCDSWHDFQTGKCNASTREDLLMGEPCPTNASGKYFLRTGHKEPFALLSEEHSKVKKSLLLDIFYELV